MQQASASAPKGTPLQRFGMIAVYFALSLLLILVLSPLLWMVLSAFKTPGTAFQLAFFPKTSVAFPEEDVDPYEFPVLEEGQPAIYFHLDDPDANGVEGIVRTPDGQERVVRLQRYFEQSWAGALALPAVQAADVALRVNSEPVAEDGFERVNLDANGPTFFGASDFVAYGKDGQGLIRLPADTGREFSVRVDGREVELAPSAGLYTAELALEGGAAFRIVERLSFGEAADRMYTVENFRAILTNPDFNFARYLFNSLVVATACALLTVLICSMASFAFVFFEFAHRDALFMALITSMLVPGMIYMVPQFSITLSLGLMDTYSGMVVPHLANVFGLFLLRQYMLQIPRDLYSAAEIDGANDMQIFRTIAVPICLPIMVTLFLLTFVTQWSNFLWQLIINTGDSQVLTLPVGLQQFKGQNANEWEKIMAGACFSILPISVLFLSLQRYFLEGLTAGGVKE